MRIGMILDKTFPPDPRVENEALTLIEAGHEVFLWVLTYDKNESQDDDYKGIKVRRYLSNTLTYKLSALAYTLPFYRMILSPKIKDFILSNKIDVLHIHDMRIAGTVFEVNKKLNLPVVLDLHDNYPEVMKEYPHLKKFPGKYLISPQKWLRKEAFFIQKADRIISVSQEFVDSIKGRLISKKEKVVLVPNTVRQSFYTKFQLDEAVLDRFKDSFVLLYIGDTGLRRGLQIAIAALPEIQKEIKNIKLVVVGKSSADAILQKQVADLQVEKLVSFEGWKNPEIFPSYIKAAGIGISPLIRSKQHDMAYANKLFQYMSLGLPVLVSDAIAQKRIVETNKTGLVHRDKDSIDFSKKVIELYRNKVLYREYAQNAENFIKDRFNWEITSKNLVKLYNDL
jgi:glycosyltransferase involved in cell wall biosynthesis